MRILLDALGSVGFIGDQAGYSMPPSGFTEVKNMRMYEGWAERVGGYAQAFARPDVVPYWLEPFSSTTARYLVHAGLTAAFVDDGGTRTALTTSLLNGGISNRITGDSYNGVLVLNNGVDNPIYWGGDPATPMAVLTNWNTAHKARSLRKFGYYMVAMNTTESGTNYPYRVRWSDKAAPGSLPAWTPAASNDANVLDRMGDGVLVDGMELGDSFILYHERSMTVMRWIGGNDVFSFQLLPDAYGMLAPTCGCVVPGVGHVVLTKGFDVIAHAGNGARSILDGQNKAWLLANIDQNYAELSFVVANHRKAEAWICFPEANQTSCTKALVWNWVTGKFSKRDLPNVVSACEAAADYSSNAWNSQTTTWDANAGTNWDSTTTVFSHNDTRLFMGTADGRIFVMDEGTKADGATFTATLERTGLNGLPTPQGEVLRDRVKDCSGMWLNVDAVAGTQLQVYLGASSDPAVAPTYSTPVTMTVGTDRWIDAWANGVYLAYKVTATDNKAFRIASVELEVQDAGAY